MAVNPLSYENGGFKTLYCGVSGQTLIPWFNGLAVCYCTTWPAGPFTYCDVWLINVKIFTDICFLNYLTCSLNCAM
jgi:hypothetical protein